MAFLAHEKPPIFAIFFLPDQLAGRAETREWGQRGRRESSRPGPGVIDDVRLSSQRQFECLERRECLS